MFWSLPKVHDHRWELECRSTGKLRASSSGTAPSSPWQSDIPYAVLLMQHQSTCQFYAASSTFGVVTHFHHNFCYIYCFMSQNSAQAMTRLSAYWLWFWPVVILFAWLDTMRLWYGWNDLLNFLPNKKHFFLTSLQWYLSIYSFFHHNTWNWYLKSLKAICLYENNVHVVLDNLQTSLWTVFSKTSLY